MAKILLAEDDDSLRGFLMNALKKAGHSVKDCGDGEEALKRLSELVVSSAVVMRAAEALPVGLSGTWR